MGKANRLNGVAALSIGAIAAANAAGAEATPSPSSAALTPAAQSLLSGVQAGQQALFKNFNEGFSKAFDKYRSHGFQKEQSFLKSANAFLKGEQSFLPAVQDAGASFLKIDSAAALDKGISHAGQAWLKLGKAFDKWAPGASAFIKDTIGGETAFWKNVGGGANAFDKVSPNPEAFQKTIDSANQSFLKSFQGGVSVLLRGSHTSRAGSAAFLKLLSVGEQSFGGAVGTGAQGFLKIKSASMGAPFAPAAPPPPAPPPPPVTPPSEEPRQLTALTLTCPASVAATEPIVISGTLSPVPDGGLVEVVYQPPLQPGASTAPEPIVKHLSVANGNFGDETVMGQGPLGTPPLYGKWIVAAAYEGNLPSFLPSLPQICEIEVHQ